ncbi:helix-turn-helix domain-containing protein [Streptomyces sp. 5-8]|uniref:Helix-turn-helix domain-containing protein n=1 Tax=Streptomyces musisoli TaxID=2802280 RepID=A0ABS1PCD0_9ACTN|nr:MULTISPECIES: XRE family transcriptional regulator [Streptomyces]MBL1110031.1 helix-turn-helix domain-containing protein [Streptomyces musisoli]MBY8841344.1 XRE family transcriptional regulator [Streptomyces sp. SP2-10]
MINRVRQLRKQRLMTLEALAERTGVTKSYLSKVERGRSVPSIAVCASLAKALDVPLDHLFADAEELAEVTVTRAGERRPLTPDQDPGTRYEGMALEAGTKSMTPFMLYPPHDADRVPFRDHPGEEFLFVHRGQVELILPSRTITLHPGDCAYFKATTPHKVRSLGAERAALLLLVADDQFHPDAPQGPHSHRP